MNRNISVLLLILVFIIFNSIEGSFRAGNYSESIGSLTSSGESTSIDTPCSGGCIGKRKYTEYNSYSNGSSTENVSKKPFIKSILKDPMILSERSKVLKFSPEIPENFTLKTLKSCLKGTRVRSKIQRKFLSFAPEIHDRVIQINNPSHDINFWKAINEEDFSLARLIVKQGYKVLSSTFNCEKFQRILQTDTTISRLNLKKKIDFLVLHQPHVFASSFECDESAFTGIHQNTANYIIQRYPVFRAAHESIFKEGLRNPWLNLDDKFYTKANLNAAWKRIDLAFASGREDMIKKCCLLPGMLYFFNIDGQTIFTEAVIKHDLERIKLLIMRNDSGGLIFFANFDNESPIDLAINDRNDSELLVFRVLLTRLDSTLESGNIYNLVHLITVFINKCRFNRAAMEISKETILKLLRRSDLEMFFTNPLEANNFINYFTEFLSYY